MPSNLELFLLAFLHGSFIAILLLLLVSVASVFLLLAFSIRLFSIVAVDLLNIYPVISWYFEEMKADLKLGLVLVLCALVDRVLGIALSLQPVFERVVFNVKVNASHLRDYVDALKLT